MPGHGVERDGLVQEVPDPDVPHGVAIRQAHGELDVDLARVPAVALLPHARQRGAREDPGPVQGHQAIDTELSLRLAPHREDIIDRHAPS